MTKHKAPTNKISIPMWAVRYAWMAILATISALILLKSGATIDVTIGSR
ncbi:hypothetical protein [Nonomuraea candida]|nr:hypothetical protein [Nonomuraea candida]